MMKTSKEKTSGDNSKKEREFKKMNSKEEKESKMTNSKEEKEPKKIEKERKKAKHLHTPKVDEHFTLDYWHGVLPNEEVLNMLKEDGDFLLRKVEGYNPNEIFLSVRWGDLLNATISINPDGGCDVEGQQFPSIKEFIDHYRMRKKPIVLSSGKTAVLGRPIHRKNWQLRRHMVKMAGGKRLGAGAYGVVYKCQLYLQNKKKPIDVAVKSLSEMGVQASSGLWKEARVMREYDHPNVLKMYGVVNDTVPFMLVMELIDGCSIEEYLKNEDNAGHSASVNTRINILAQAASGLEYLHSKGCIHRDIASRNLLIQLKTMTVKVSDFGMTRKSSNYKIDPSRPMNLRWMAPEVYDTNIANKATDVYAYGVTMYECFTQPYEMPYAAWGSNKVYEKVINQGYRLEPTPLMPRVVADLMRDCLGPADTRPNFQTIALILRNHLPYSSNQMWPDVPCVYVNVL